jgi:hypothetical protein
MKTQVRQAYNDDDDVFDKGEEGFFIKNQRIIIMPDLVKG